MAVTKMLARNTTFHLNTGTSGAPTWVQVKGINSWSHDPQSTDADTTDFDDDGRQSHLKASRGDQFSIEGLRKSDTTTGARDPGQEAVEAWGQEIGPDSIKQFRITLPDTHTITFDASVTVTVGGGGNDDPNAWSAAITASGAVTYA